MRRNVLPMIALSVLASSQAPAGEKEPRSYPAGTSVQTFRERTFELVVPEGPAPARKFSLLLALAMSPSTAGDAPALAKDGFVICCPQPLRGPMWATSEAADVLELVDHLAVSLPLARDRLHVMQASADHGFSSFVAFDKASEALSLALVDTSTFRGKSPSAGAKQRTAVLSLWGKAEPDHGYDGSDILRFLEGKVRTLEWRRGTNFDPYFRYWLHVADGRFQPGWDLSFEWIADAPPPKAAPAGKAAPPPAPAPPPPIEIAKARSAEQKCGAFLYFWSAADAEKPEARALQNDVFFRPELREVGARLVAAKLEREKHAEAFRSFGLTTTPAVVVLDAAFAPKKTFEGPIDGKALAAALKSVAPPAKKTR